jgi:hypothetical protein
MAVSITKFGTNDHTLILNLGTQEIELRHLSDLEIAALRAAFPATENVTDTTGEVIINGN